MLRLVSRLEKNPSQVSQFGVQALFFFHGENLFDTKNTIKAGGSTARAQNVDWMDGWMDTP